MDDIVWLHPGKFTGEGERVGVNGNRERREKRDEREIEEIEEKVNASAIYW